MENLHICFVGRYVRSSEGGALGNNEYNGCLVEIQWLSYDIKKIRLQATLLVSMGCRYGKLKAPHVVSSNNCRIDVDKICDRWYPVLILFLFLESFNSFLGGSSWIYRRNNLMLLNALSFLLCLHNIALFLFSFTWGTRFGRSNRRAGSGRWAGTCPRPRRSWRGRRWWCRRPTSRSRSPGASAPNTRKTNN